MKDVFKKMFLLVAIFPVLLLSGCGKNAETEKEYGIQLEIWGVLDGSDAFTPIINAYKELNPHVKNIKYRKLTQDTYEKELLDAMTEGNTPDIFLIQNSWLPSYASKIEPAPGLIVGMDEVKSNFVDTVLSDFVSNGKIYALPLSVDSLGLYYNKDLFNAAGITQPPTKWTDFSEYVQKLTRKDATGNIEIAGAAFGTSYNINRSTDILSTLIMQNGGTVINSKGDKCEMDIVVTAPNGETGNLGETALKYYTQFADPDSDLYTWNNEMHYSIDAFSQGKAAMMFNYSWHIDTVKNKNGKLNFDVAPLPQAYQAPNQANFSNYWGFAVSRNKVLKEGESNEVRVQEAWQFIKFLTMVNDGSFKVYNAYSKANSYANKAVKIDPASVYAEKTKRPAARRDIIEKQKSDPVIGVFAKGNLIARNFPQKNPVAIEKIMAEMIDLVTRGGATTTDAIFQASAKITDTLR